jgi:hypothetical protein
MFSTGRWIVRAVAAAALGTAGLAGAVTDGHSWIGSGPATTVAGHDWIGATPDGHPWSNSMPDGNPWHG